MSKRLAVATYDSLPKKLSKEYKLYGKKAEYYWIFKSMTSSEIVNALENAVNKDTIEGWAAKYRWVEKRKRRERQLGGIKGLAHDMLFSEFMEMSERQEQGDKLTLNDVQKLEKLLAIHKRAGTPFYEQVDVVMQVFLRYIDNNSNDNENLKLALLNIVKTFIEDVDNGDITEED